MEDLKRRLQFQNTFVQLQAVKTLHRRLVQIYNESGQKFTRDSKHPDELVLLWTHTTLGDVLVSEACTDVLITLVLDGHAEICYVLQNFVNLAPTAKQLSGVVHGVTQLLLVQLPSRDHEQSYVCPYGIRTNTHPYVNLTLNRSDIARQLLTQLQQLLHSDHYHSLTLLELFSPWLEYIMLDPLQSASKPDHERLVLRQNLVAMLTNVPQSKVDIVQWIMKKIPMVQIHFPWQQEQLQSDLINLYTVISEDSNSSHYQSLMFDICTHMLSIYHCYQKGMGVDWNPALKMMLKMAQQIPQAFIDNGNLIVITNLILTAQSTHYKALLDIVDAILCSPLSSDISHTELSMLTVAVINIVSLIPLLPTNCSSITKTAVKCLEKIQNIKKNEITKVNELILPTQHQLAVTPLAYYMQTIHSLVQNISHDHLLASDWLKTIDSSLSQPMSYKADLKIFTNLACVITAQCIINTEEKALRTAVNAAVKLVQKDSTQIPLIVTVFMYCLQHHNNSDSQLILLKALPHLATNKMVSGPVYKTIQILCNNQSLRPIAMPILLSLWKQDSRVYIDLHQQLLNVNIKSVGYDCVLSKATCIRDICKLKPDLHGSDMLTMISDLLNSCVDGCTSAAAVIAMQGLYELCVSQVVDLRTVWSVLSDKLLADSRPDVLIETCKLLSLVHQLKVETQAYQLFSLESFTLLWSFSQSQHASVRSAAFSALSEFPRTMFLVENVPENIRILMEVSLVPKEDVDDAELRDSTTDDEGTEIPGDAYIKLMKKLPDDSYSSYNKILSAFLAQEVAALPRGLHFNKSQTTSNIYGGAKVEKKLKAIPPLYKKLHGQCTDGRMKSKYAVCMLLSYTSQIDISQDKEPKKVVLVTNGRGYHQMLYTLINESSCDISGWHEALVLSDAWMSYMSKCYNTYLQSRLAELELQLDRGAVKDLDEHNYNKSIAWLWTRDKITDLIKSCSRSSAQSLANSVFALAGLSLAVMAFTSDLDSELEVTLAGSQGHIAHTHWLNMTVNSLLVLSDPEFKPDGQFIVLGNQRVESHSLSSGGSSRGHALMSLCHLLPSMMVTQPDLAPIAMSLIATVLDNNVISDKDNHLCHIWAGLACGKLLGVMFAANATEIDHLMALVTQLEKICYTDDPNRLPFIVGLGLCVTGMCNDLRQHTQDCVRAVIEQISVALEMGSPDEADYQVWSVCIGSISVAAYNTNILPVSHIDQLVTMIYQAAMQYQCSNLFRCLGATLHGLVSVEHPTAKELLNILVQDWQTQIAQDNSLTHVVTGLMATLGSEKLWFSCTNSDMRPTHTVDVALLLSIEQAKLTMESEEREDVIPWTLAHFYSVLTQNTQNSGSVPSSYSYLPSNSILSPLTQMLIQAGKSGTTTYSNRLVACAVECLSFAAAGGRLPPINWPAILAPLIRSDFDASVHCLVFKFALKQCVSNNTITQFLTSWITTTLWNTLHIDCKKQILLSLHQLARSCPVSKLEEFCLGTLAVLFTESGVDNDVLCESGMMGLSEALQISDPVQHVMPVLYHTVQTIYPDVDVEKYQSSLLLQSLYECLSFVPPDIREALVQSDLTALPSCMRGGLVTCYLVSHGLEPLQWLNMYIEAIMYNQEDKNERWKSLCMVQEAFLKRKHDQAEQLTWLLELLGHVKNIATGIVPVQDDINLEMVLEFAVLVFSSAIVSWSDRGSLCLALGLTDHTFSSRGCNEDMILNTLPLALQNLMNANSWKSLGPKIIDWLLTMRDHTPKFAKLQTIFIGCLMSLRYNDHYKNIWSSITN